MRVKLLAVAGVSALLFVLNFHILIGLYGVRVIPRVTFSLSESVVNEDALRSMPAIIALSEFPLLMLAIMRDDEIMIEAARKIANQ